MPLRVDSGTGLQTLSASILVVFAACKSLSCASSSLSSEELVAGREASDPRASQTTSECGACRGSRQTGVSALLFIRFNFNSNHSSFQCNSSHCIASHRTAPPPDVSNTARELAERISNVHLF